MVDWQSPAEIALDGAAFAKFIHVLLGLYIWEFVTSLDFEWQFLSGKKIFRWPLTFYFAGRYTLLFALIGIAIALNVTTEINCQALYTFNQLFGNASIGFASINLSLRTMAVWSQRWYIVVPLVAITMGQWSFLLHGVLLTAEWVPEEGCVIEATHNQILAISFIYTMVFDLVVLCLTGWKLMLSTGNIRSKLMTLIFRDGLIFFFIAFLSNLLATIFMLLNLNGVMSVIANVPAAIASTIVACRAVRRLTNYAFTGPELFTDRTQASTQSFRSQTRRPVIAIKKGGTLDGVHVQMESFSSPDNAYPHYDASGNVIPQRSVDDVEKGRGLPAKASDDDVESQVVHEDFKRPSY